MGKGTGKTTAKARATVKAKATVKCKAKATDKARAMAKAKAKAKATAKCKPRATGKGKPTAKGQATARARPMGKGKATAKATATGTATDRHKIFSAPTHARRLFQWRRRRSLSLSASGVDQPRYRHDGHSLIMRVPDTNRRSPHARHSISMPRVSWRLRTFTVPYPIVPAASDAGLAARAGHFAFPSPLRENRPKGRLKEVVEMKVLQRQLWAFAFACALVAVSTDGATAARASTARASDLCSVSKAVATNIANSTKTSSIEGSPTKLKAFWGKIQSAEPSITGAAPGSLKPRFTRVFAFINNVVGDLNKVNWNFTGLVPYEKTLVAQANKEAPDITALKAYYRTTCHFDV
jgi:hypothetical protein